MGLKPFWFYSLSSELHLVAAACEAFPSI